MSPLAEPTISQSSLQNPQALVSLQQVPMGERDMGRNSGRTIGSLSPHVQSALSELGLPVEPQYANELRAKVRSLLNYQGEGFSGSQHVPFAPSHLQLLGREDYFVCEKACALRSLMIMICTPKGPAAFLLDSDDSVRYLQLHFPLPKDGTKFHHETLMDGEVIVELGQKPPLFRYMAFDLMAINGTSITSRPFTTRLGYLQSELIKPHKAWVQKHPEFKSPCMVDMKRQERSYGLNILLTELSKTRYQNEGLLFTPVRFPYEPGAGSGHILKWRAAECIFLDLKIKVLYDQERKPRYQLHVLGPANFTKFFDHFTASPETAEIFRSTPGGADGRIAEFNYDVNWMTLLWEQGYTPTPRKGGWRFVRFSTDDKTCPDDEETAAQKRSWVIDGVNGDTLVSHLDLIRAQWKAREKAAAQNTPGSVSQIEAQSQLVAPSPVEKLLTPPHGLPPQQVHQQGILRRQSAEADFVELNRIQHQNQSTQQQQHNSSVRVSEPPSMHNLHQVRSPPNTPYQPAAQPPTNHSSDQQILSAEILEITTRPPPATQYPHLVRRRSSVRSSASDAVTERLSSPSDGPSQDVQPTPTPFTSEQPTLNRVSQHSVPEGKLAPPTVPAQIRTKRAVVPHELIHQQQHTPGPTPSPQSSGASSSVEPSLAAKEGATESEHSSKNVVVAGESQEGDIVPQRVNKPIEIVAQQEQPSQRENQTRSSSRAIAFAPVVGVSGPLGSVLHFEKEDEDYDAEEEPQQILVNEPVTAYPMRPVTPVTTMPGTAQSAPKPSKSARTYDRQPATEQIRHGDYVGRGDTVQRIAQSTRVNRELSADAAQSQQSHHYQHGFHGGRTAYPSGDTGMQYQRASENMSSNGSWEGQGWSGQRYPQPQGITYAREPRPFQGHGQHGAGAREETTSPMSHHQPWEPSPSPIPTQSGHNSSIPVSGAARIPPAKRSHWLSTVLNFDDEMSQSDVDERVGYAQNPSVQQHVPPPHQQMVGAHRPGQGNDQYAYGYDYAHRVAGPSAGAYPEVNASVHGGPPPTRHYGNKRNRLA